MESQEFHKQNFDRVKSEASEMAEIILLPNGIQAKVYGTKVVLTFYYRTKTYHLNISGSMVLFTPGRERKVIEKYFTKTNHVNNYMVTLPENIALPVHKKPENKVIELTDKGTKACIDHISRKIETYKRVHLADEGEKDHKTLAMLKSLQVELEQYL